MVLGRWMILVRIPDSIGTIGDRRELAERFESRDSERTLLDVWPCERGQDADSGQEDSGATIRRLDQSLRS